VSKEDEKIVSLLEELVKWARVTSIPHVKKLLTEILVSTEERIAYQSSNGKKTSRQVAKQAAVSQKTVSLWWKKWIKAGIAEPISARRGKRAKRLFSLDDFGINIQVKGS